MSGLAGTAFVAIWHDIVPEGKTDFYEWHNREHMPERTSIAGFQRGRRYIADPLGVPEYFNLYEVDSPEILTSPDYLARLNSPTPWTRRAVVHFRDVSRSLCRVGASFGCGQGGFVMTWRLEAAANRAGELADYLARTALPEAAERPGVLGAHFGTADKAGSEIVTEEKKQRGGGTLVPGWVILLEGISPATLATAAETALADPVLIAHGAEGPIPRGMYRLETSRGKTASAAT